MKQYKVTPAFFENEEDYENILDLVNVDDDEDRWMATPDEFFVGEILNESEFITELCIVILDDGSERNAYFASRTPVQGE